LALYLYRIVFIRHGETDWNAEGRLQGQRDQPLNGRGRAQASAVGRMLAKRMRAEIDRLEAADAFVASPLIRTRETMELARAAMGLEPKRYRVFDELKELTFGEWEGLTWEEVAAIDAKAERERQKDKWRYTPPGGESYAALAERIAAWLATRRGDMFVASHGGVARALMYLLGGLDPQRAPNADVPQGRALVLEPDGRFSWVG
jgi:probable phosphoglycerate mutase